MKKVGYGQFLFCFDNEYWVEHWVVHFKIWNWYTIYLYSQKI